MHCVLLGVCRQLMRLWLLSQYHEEMWYLGTKLSVLDDRLMNIKPPKANTKKLIFNTKVLER